MYRGPARRESTKMEAEHIDWSQQSVEEIITLLEEVLY